MADIRSLPRIDEHATVVAADPAAVWAALLETVDGIGASPAGAGYARLVRSRYPKASGPRPLAEGSTIPGFRVETAVPVELLALEGRHAFSEYALVFRIEHVDSGSSRLSAESRAAFPGPHGRLYRALVIGTRGHVVAVRGILARVRRRAERA
ncbi:MAG TPA: hypothetical protein VJ804_03155 [Acidimicrobiales bacterium]|nr:hypothetical protein [Acidimicrobiales bacterium]